MKKTITKSVTFHNKTPGHKREAFRRELDGVLLSLLANVIEQNKKYIIQITSLKSERNDSNEIVIRSELSYEAVGGES